jgi:Ser/Thr protein kinase RdoA (MazF antagonist)
MTDDEALALAVQAAAQWGGAGPAVPRLIAKRENTVFEVELPEAARAALRLHRVGYQSDAAIESELWLVSELALRGVPVPLPLATQAGRLVAELGQGQRASVVLWAEGCAIGQAMLPLTQSPAEQVRIYNGLGQLLAGLHATADDLTLPPGFSRPDWGAEGLVGEAPFWGRFWEHPGLNDVEQRVMLAARHWCRVRLAGFAHGDQGVIHADVLRENVLVDGDALTLIDFDDCGTGFRLYDLGTALCQSLMEPHLAAIAAGLIEGYSAVRPLDAEARAMVPVFTLLRTLASVGWTMPRLPPHHPAARAHIDRAVRAARIVMAGGDLLA